MPGNKNIGGAPSEDDLFAQWDFLDSLADKQAVRLRSGIQDSEDADDAPISMAEMNALKGQVASLQTQIETMQTSLKTANAAVINAESALKLLKSQNDQAVAQLNAVVSERNALDSQLRAANLKIHQLQQSIANLQVQQTQGIATFQIRERELTQKLQESESRIRTLQSSQIPEKPEFPRPIPARPAVPQNPVPTPVVPSAPAAPLNSPPISPPESPLTTPLPAHPGPPTPQIQPQNPAPNPHRRVLPPGPMEDEEEDAQKRSWWGRRQ